MHYTDYIDTMILLWLIIWAIMDRSNLYIRYPCEECGNTRTHKMSCSHNDGI